MTQDSLRAALETLDGLATAVIAMKLAIPIGRPLGPEWQAFLARTGDVNRWLDENDRVQGRAALASPDTGVAEGAGLDVERLARALAASYDEEGVLGALGHGGDPRLGNAAEQGPWATAYADLAAEVAAHYDRLDPNEHAYVEGQPNADFYHPCAVCGQSKAVHDGGISPEAGASPSTARTSEKAPAPATRPRDWTAL